MANNIKKRSGKAKMGGSTSFKVIRSGESKNIFKRFGQWVQQLRDS